MKFIEDWIKEYLEKKGYLVAHPSQYRADFEPAFQDLWKQVQPFTLTSPERGYAVFKGAEYLNASHLEGAFVECGVYKGGSSLLAALSFRHFGDLSRKFWLYDTFTGMPAPGDEDKISFTNQPLSERNPQGWWNADMKQVHNLFVGKGIPSDQVKLIPGLVEETLQKEVPEKIAFLRLDTDWYESTKVELEVLYERLVPGGVLIIDDYGHFTGARKAVDDFFRNQNIFLNRLDYTGRLLIKPSK